MNSAVALNHHHQAVSTARMNAICVINSAGATTFTKLAVAIRRVAPDVVALADPTTRSFVESTSLTRIPRNQDSTGQRSPRRQFCSSTYPTCEDILILILVTILTATTLG